MAQYTVNNINVDAILTWIQTKYIAIPEIQRPFVWDATKVRDLIDSLYRGYPIGYLITWQNHAVKLKDGSFSGGKKILIDGQQRVTAMTAALVGDKVVNQQYKKIRIIISFNPIEEKFEVYNSAIAKDSKWLDDISKVYSTDFDAFSYVSEYAKANGVNPGQINNVIQKLLAIKSSNIGVIELASTLDIETVTDIFIRINSKGVVLSQADFAMSKISSSDEYHGDLIRKTIDYFCHLNQRPMDLEDIKENDPEFANTDSFKAIEWIASKPDEIYVPQYNDVLRVAFTSQFMRGRLSDLVSLLSGRDFETREYYAEIAADSFQKLFEGVKKFVNQTNYERYLMIIKSAGITDKSLIRSQNVLNFGYILYIRLRDKGYDSNKIEQIVRRWMVLTILTGRYSGSPESAFDYDIKRFDTDDPMEFLHNTEEGELSDAYWGNVLINRMNTSVASSPYFNLYLMAQCKTVDKGFLCKDITVPAMIQNRGDIHHLFPKQYFRKHGINERGVYNQIGNYVMTQSEINIRITDSAPKEYMSIVENEVAAGKVGICGIVDHEQLAENLKANCIPENFDQYDFNDYQTFLQKRRKLMAQKIKDYYYSL